MKTLNETACGICGTKVASLADLAADKHVCTKTLKQAYDEVFALNPPPVSGVDLAEDRSDLLSISLSIWRLLDARKQKNMTEIEREYQHMAAWLKRWNDRMTKEHLQEGKKAA